MNEVTKIHLGRQAFTISVNAHHELEDYLLGIRKQVEDKDVVGEIELRMAELLLEHGISEDKVVLLGDIDFLKEQLGNPKDFTDNSNEGPSPKIKSTDSKRLFRDTDNAMIAGVAVGLAEYFGLDVLLIRILFVIAVLVTVGWGILLYIVLWLLVPEAKTSSDRLRMAGKSVTVDGLKEIVERADFKGAALRVNATMAGPINHIFRVVLKVIGVIFIISGLSVLFGLITAGTYILINHNIWAKYNVFPIGFREHLLLYLVMLIIGLIALFIVLFGIAMFRRKWPIRTWATGTLIGLILIGAAIGGALAEDVYPNIRDRYNANFHTTTRLVKPFTAISTTGTVDIKYAFSNSYSVSMQYYGHPNLSTVKTTVQNGTLTINTDKFNWNRNCKVICIPNSNNLSITVYSPNTSRLEDRDIGKPTIPPLPYKP